MAYFPLFEARYRQIGCFTVMERKTVANAARSPLC